MRHVLIISVLLACAVPAFAQNSDGQTAPDPCLESLHGLSAAVLAAEETIQQIDALSIDTEQQQKRLDACRERSGKASKGGCDGLAKKLQAAEMRLEQAETRLDDDMATIDDAYEVFATECDYGTGDELHEWARERILSRLHGNRQARATKAAAAPTAVRQN